MPHEANATLDRWLRLMDAWGFLRNEETYNALVASYSAKGRYYHTLDHIAACLRHLDQFAADLTYPREVELALWFHDAIYEPLSGGNERKSAEWAVSFLSENGAPPEATARVHRLIMVTEHNAPTQTVDESVLVDIDLAILGASPETYDVFEQAIRKEYSLVPAFIYRRKRAEILRGFLERDRIYQNEPFCTERERQARENLLKAIIRLGGPD